MALLGTLGESDVVRNGRDVWIWSSKDKTATHCTAPRAAGAGPQPGLASGDALTPQQAGASRR